MEDTYEFKDVEPCIGTPYNEYQEALDVLKNFPGIDDSDIMQRYVSKLQKLINDFYDLGDAYDGLKEDYKSLEFHCEQLEELAYGWNFDE